MKQRTECTFASIAVSLFFFPDSDVVVIWGWWWWKLQEVSGQVSNQNIKHLMDFPSISQLWRRADHFLTPASNWHPPIFNPASYSYIHLTGLFKLILPLQEFLVFFRTRVVLHTCSWRVLVSDATQIRSSEIEGITPIINQLLLGTKVSFHHLLLGLPHHSLNTALPRLGADICFSWLILYFFFFPSQWILTCASLNGTCCKAATVGSQALSVSATGRVTISF